jgi:ribosomal protein S16
MLAIRMQRTGRKGHAMFRVVVQDSRLTPTSGRVVALLGSYDPHAKTSTLVKEKAAFYLANGAQPSPRVVHLFETEGVTLPDWVKKASQKSRTIRHADKLRKNRPAEPTPAAENEEKVAETAPADQDATSTEAKAETEQ